MTRHINRIRRSRVSGGFAVLVGAFAWVLLMSNFSPAPAAQGSVTIEQHSELLSETISGVATGTNIAVHRGVLPGGTTRFDPQPTATLEIVARHVGGQSGSAWAITLIDDLGTPINATPITLSNTASAWGIRTATISWPSADVSIQFLNLTRTGVAGVLSIQKAYIKIHQEGLIKKTAGRLPMGTKQVGVSTSEWSALTEPGIYHHNAADFDPAPSIKLRVSGAGNRSGCPLITQLRNTSQSSWGA